MKKIVIIVAAMALALVSSCNKELNTDVTTPSNSETHELFVSLPKLIDAETKATIAEADGSFSWTAGDFIAVKTSTNDVYKFTAAGDGNSVRFTYTGEMNGTPTTVVYPYTDDATVADLPAEITSLTGALGEDGIRLSGTVSDNAVSMDYENAFLKVSFSNVPTFASKVKFECTASGYAQTVVVSGISLSTKGSVVAYIPVQSGEYSFTVSLIDNANNTMISKSTSSAKSFTAGTLKKMANTPLGTLVMMSNTGSSYGGFSNMKVYNWWTGGSHNVTEPLAQITISETAYGYYFLPASLGAGEEVNIKVENGSDASQNTQTVVYNLRDFTFTIKSSNGGIATTYRYYFNNTNSWSQVNAYIWDEYNTAKNGAWPGNILTNTASNGWYYYEFTEGEYGYTRHVKFSDNEASSGGDHNNCNPYRDWLFTN